MTNTARQVLPAFTHSLNFAEKRTPRMDDIEELLKAPRHWIGSEWRPSHGSGPFEVIDPSKPASARCRAERHWAERRRRVREASRALPAWSKTPLEERLLLRERLCDVIEGDADDIASLITRKSGVRETWRYSKPPSAAEDDARLVL